MSVKKAAAAPEKAHSQKFIACLQSSGRIGKSTFAEALLHWLQFAGIPFAAVDSDAEHRTLSKRNRNILFFDATEDREQFAELIENLPEAPVAIADFPAQATGFLLENWRRFRVSEILAGRGARMVNVIFASDDETALFSGTQILRQFGTEQSDYVIVRNPARSKTAEFEKTQLYRNLKEAGAREILMPAMTAATLNAVKDLARKEGRHVSLSGAAESPDTGMLARFELQYFLNVTMTQMEDLAGVLLPSPDLIKRRVFRPEAESAQAEIDPFNL